MKRLFLHIGMSKTGTTALQQFLHHNRALLHAHGWHYPQTADAGNGHEYFGKSFIVQPPPGMDMVMPPAQRDFLREMRDELDRVERDIVISSETLCFADIDRLKTYFRGYDATIVCYLRRQDERVESQYNQMVKVKQMTDTIEQFIEKIPILDYLAFLQSWEAAFGRDRLIIRPYERSKLDGGSTIHDFLHLVGIDSRGVATPLAPDRVNISLSRLGIEVILRLNRQPAVLTKALQDRLLDDPALVTVGKAPILLTPDQRRQLLARYAAGNRALSARYLDGGELFAPPQYQPLPPKPTEDQVQAVLRRHGIVLPHSA